MAIGLRSLGFDLNSIGHVNTPVVTFDRVFDIQRRAGSRFQQQHTQFSFSSNGTPHYSVSVHGWPTVAEGMTITALLREADNWQSLAGWVNHQSGEIVAPNCLRSALNVITTAALAAFSSLLSFGAGAYPASLTGKIFAGLSVATLALLCVSNTRQYLRERRERNVILALLPGLQPSAARPPPA